MKNIKKFKGFISENLNPRKEAILSANKNMSDILSNSDLEVDHIGDEYIHVTFNNKMYSISTQYSGYDSNGQIKCDFFISNDDDSFGYYDINGVLDFFNISKNLSENVNSYEYFDEIPSAFEFCKSLEHEENDEFFYKAMVDFAKAHVEAALKQASEKASLTEFAYEFLQEGAIDAIDKNSIINSYPLDNIK